MTPELTNMLIGVLIGACPFVILWGIANRRARDWQDLAEKSVKNHELCCKQLLRAERYTEVLQDQMREWGSEKAV